jgi:hypothetical protein
MMLWLWMRAIPIRKDVKKGPDIASSAVSLSLSIIALVTPLAIGLTKGFSSTNQLEESDSLDYGSGYPVWSDDDGASIAGVDMYWSEGLIFPPLQGWTGSVNPRFKVFVLEDGIGGRRKDLVTAKHHARSLYFMKTAGYILVNYATGDTTTALVVPLDGGKVRTSDLLSNMATTIPSRDGSIIAGITWKSDYTTLRKDEIYGYDTELRVVFVDANTMTPLGEPKSLTARVAIYNYSSYRSRQHPFFFWDDKNDALHITDLKQYSVALSSTDGTVTTVEVPTCLPFPTSSGSVRDSDGARLSVDSEGEQVMIASNTLSADSVYDGYASPWCIN